VLSAQVSVSLQPVSQQCSSTAVPSVLEWSWWWAGCKWKESEQLADSGWQENEVVG